MSNITLPLSLLSQVTELLSQVDFEGLQSTTVGMQAANAYKNCLSAVTRGLHFSLTSEVSPYIICCLIMWEMKACIRLMENPVST